MKSILVFLFVIFGFCEGLMWLGASNGKIPGKALNIDIGFGRTVFYCRVKNLDGSSLGIITKGGKNCQMFAKSGVILFSRNYEVLSKTNSKSLNVGWVESTGGDQVPAGAVSCGPDCYLGQSQSADSICQESIGQISPSSNRILMVRNKAVSVCPFYTYLVVKQESSEEDSDETKSKNSTNEKDKEYEVKFRKYLNTNIQT